jgi:hypothetical protein
MSCWKSICRKEKSPLTCLLRYLDCETADLDARKRWANSTNVFTGCDPNGNTTFKYGIFENAVTKNVVSSNFVEKYFYCLWWGLQQLRYAISEYAGYDLQIYQGTSYVTSLNKFCSFFWFLMNCFYLLH